MTLAKLARWCYRRRRLVVLMWIAGFVVLNQRSTSADFDARGS